MKIIPIFLGLLIAGGCLGFLWSIAVRVNEIAGYLAR